MNKPIPKYEIGELVSITFGDGRPHQITRIEWHDGLHCDGWWKYYFSDKRTPNDENELKPFIDKHLLERIYRLLEYHLCFCVSEWDDGVNLFNFMEKFRNIVEQTIQ